MRPSGESAGDVAESVKLVSCVYSRRAGAVGRSSRNTISALPAASTTATRTAAAADRIRRAAGTVGATTGWLGNSTTGVVTGAVNT